MSRSVVAFLAVSIILCSCSSEKGVDRVAELQAGFRSCSTLEFSADIRADYGDRVYDYGISYTGSVPAGTLTIVKPETAAGVTVKYSGGAAGMSYDGVEIYTGQILPGGLSPVDAVPVLLSALADGLVTGTVEEKWDGTPCLAAIFRIDDRVDARVWFDTQALLPLHAEIYFDGARVIECDFYNMKVE